MIEPTLDDVFKAANGGQPGSAAGQPGQDDNDGGIAVKSAEELEAEAAAASAAASAGAAAGDGGDSATAGAGQGDDNGSAASADADGDDYSLDVMMAFVEAVSDANGVEIDYTGIKSPEDMVKAVDEIVKAKSTPVYANEISEEFDLFLKGGGDPLEFMREFVGDISSSAPQSQEEKEEVVRGVLKDAGFSDRQIDRKIDSYIENDTLDDEVNDALDILKRKNAKNIEESIKEKRRADAENEAAQKKLLVDINNYIDSMTTIRDIPVTKEQAKNLKDYLLKFDKDGMTGYQRDFSKSISNIIESAFFTQNKTSLLKAAQSKGSSDAMSKLKSVLKTNNKMAGTQGGNRNNSSEGFDQWIKQAAALTGRKAA
jgi:hypothetical protein